jgi:hypothetical protein
MTSEVLRKLLVAGAAVAALSVAACQKPADKTDAAPAADATAPATADANAAAAAAAPADANAAATNAMEPATNAPKP